MFKLGCKISHIIEFNAVAPATTFLSIDQFVVEFISFEKTAKGFMANAPV